MNEHDGDPQLVIPIPRLFGSDDEVVVSTRSMRYGKIEIQFIDAEGIAYDFVRQSINFVPVEKRFSFVVASAKDNIHVYMESHFHIGESRRKDAWAALVRVAVVAIQPIIVEKLVHRIFRENAPVEIGGVIFTSEGFSRKKLFGGVDSVLWNPEIYRPTIENGEWTVYSNSGDGNRRKKFCTIDFGCRNGPLVDELVLRCYRVRFGRKQ